MNAGSTQTSAAHCVCPSVLPGGDRQRDNAATTTLFSNEFSDDAFPRELARARAKVAAVDAGKEQWTSNKEALNTHSFEHAKRRAERTVAVVVEIFGSHPELFELPTPLPPRARL